VVVGATVVVVFDTKVYDPYNLWNSSMLETDPYDYPVVVVVVG